MVRGGGLVDVVMAGGFRLFFGFWAWPIGCLGLALKVL